MRLAAPLLTILCLAGTAAHAQPPELDYVQFCAGCHGFDGAGSARNDVPDIRNNVSHLAAVPSGRAFLIQVAGVAQAPLDDTALARLMNWLLARFDPAHLPADFEPYSADEVGRLRDTRPGDLMALRAVAVTDLARAAAATDTNPTRTGAP